MKNEKYYVMANLISHNERVLPKVFDKLTVEEQKLVIKNFLGQRTENLSDVVKQIETYSQSLLEWLITFKPYLIEFVEVQTEELCLLALKTLLEYDNTVAGLFSDFKVQTPEIVDLAVSADGRAYACVKEELKTYDLALKAVKSNSAALKYVHPKFQTEELLTEAVVQWAKAVRWVNCEDEKLRKSIVLLAMGLNLQSIPSPREFNLTSDLREAYKELCIKANYFPEAWGTLLNFSQEQLYSMLQVRIQWIESHLIFDLLDKEHKIKALKEGLMLYTLEHLTVQDLLELATDEEVLGILLTLITKELKIEYFNHLTDSNNTEGQERLKRVIKQDREFLRSIGDIAFLLDDQDYLDDILEIVTN